MVLFKVYNKYGKELIALNTGTPGPEVIKLFSCSTQLGMKNS